MDALPSDQTPRAGRDGTGPARTWAAAAGAALCLLIGWFPFVRGTSVPFLWYVDLGFHELGHLITIWAPRLIYFAMGSVNQIAVPLGLAAYFVWWRRDRVAGGLCLAWAGTSAANVSIYIADAPYQRLPLIGGLHDWATILGPEHLNMLGAAHPLAVAVKVFGALCVLGGFGVCVWVAIQVVPRRPRAPSRPAAIRPAMPSLASDDPVAMWR